MFEDVTEISSNSEHCFSVPFPTARVFTSLSESRPGTVHVRLAELGHPTARLKRRFHPLTMRAALSSQNAIGRLI